MFKWPSIEQYRTAIRNVKQRAQYTGRDESGEPTYNTSATLPMLKYRGTVKLHGTNAAVVHEWPRADQFTYQSRERILELTSDNAGFMLNMMSKVDVFREFTRSISNRAGDGEWLSALRRVIYFGEWCGQGIQKGVAVSEVPKMFVIFGLKYGYINDDGAEETAWLNIEDYRDIESPENGIYNIMNFPSYEVEIDFEKPEIAQNKMIEITEAVEAECPVGKAFGVSGVGEGVVWAPVTEGWQSSDFWFKIKGEKHSVSKVKTLAPVDVELIAAQRDFINSVVTEARLEQGLDNLVREQLKPFEMSSLGDFIRWIYNDVIKEETDTIIANQYDPKKLGSPIADVARKWYIQRVNA